MSVNTLHLPDGIGGPTSPSRILAFAGPIESGKSTISTVVAEQLNAPLVRFDDYLKKRAAETGRPAIREALQELADEMVRQDVRGFCSEVLKQRPWQAGVPLVIDGLRHVEVVDALRELLAPAVEHLFYIHVDCLTQAKRFRQDTLSHEKSLEELERHPTEIQVRTVLLDRADLVLDGAHPVEELVGQILAFLTRCKEGNEIRDWEQKNTRRIQLARKKNREGLTALELAEFDQLQTTYSDYLDAKFPRTPLDVNRLDEIEARLRARAKSPGGD
jgi:dephospho-CoA kinase